MTNAAVVSGAGVVSGLVGSGVTTRRVTIGRRSQVMVEWRDDGSPFAHKMAALAGVHSHRRMRCAFVSDSMATGSDTGGAQHAAVIERRIQYHPVRIGMTKLAGFDGSGMSLGFIRRRTVTIMATGGTASVHYQTVFESHRKPRSHGLVTGTALIRRGRMVCGLVRGIMTAGSLTGRSQYVAVIKWVFDRQPFPGVMTDFTAVRGGRVISGFRFLVSAMTA